MFFFQIKPKYLLRVDIFLILNHLDHGIYLFRNCYWQVMTVFLKFGATQILQFHFTDGNLWINLLSPPSLASWSSWMNCSLFSEYNKIG